MKSLFSTGTAPLILGLVLTFVFLASGANAAEARDLSANRAVIDSVLGQTLSLKDKVVYVDFWASWCLPCRHSFPWMKEMAARYADKGFQVVTVNLDKKHADAEKFLHETQAAFHVIYDSTGALAKAFQVDAMPTSFLYDRDGHLHSRHRGFKEDETRDLDSVINLLINRGTGK